MKAFGFKILLLTAALLLSPCANAELPPPVGGEAVLLAGEKIESLDPVVRLNPAERNASALVCETLYNLKNGRAVENLVLRSQYESAGKMLHVWLKPGVLFHDGSPLQAAEVKQSFERLLAVSTGSPYKWLLSGIAGAERASSEGRLELSAFKIVSSYEFVIELREADPAWTLNLTHPATAICKDSGENGSGPFRLVSKRGGETRLEANLDYRGGRPFLDRLTLRYSEGASAERRILKRAGSDGSISGRVRSADEGRIFSAAVSGPVALYANPGRNMQDAKRFAALLRAAFDCREAIRLFEPRLHSAFEGEKDAAVVGGCSCAAFAPSLPQARGLAESLSKRDVVIVLRSDDPALILPAQRLELELEAVGLSVELRTLGLDEYRAVMASGEYDYEFAWDMSHPSAENVPTITLYRIVPEAYISNPLTGGVSFDELGLMQWADVWEAVQ